MFGQLGKRAAVKDHRTLQFKNYVQLPQAPPARSWFKQPISDYGAMLNNDIGDCVCATDGHAIQIWTMNALNTMVTVPDNEILQMYEQVGGYVPGQPNTDQGCILTNGLNYFRNHGIAGHKILAYASVLPAETQHFNAAVNMFGIVSVGLQLPISAQTQDVWDMSTGVNAAPGSWGGHNVPVCAYDRDHIFCVTWGRPKAMTRNFLVHYCDEAYALLSNDWIKKNGKSVSNFNLAALKTDLTRL